MSSDYDSGDGPNPIPKPLESRFESVTIEGSNPVLQNLEASVEPIGDSDNAVREFDEVSTELQLETSFNGSIEENGDHEGVDSDDEPIDFGSDARGFGDGDDADTVLWRRKNSELEGDGPPSPSNSGYAGERGSSGASSGSRTGDLSEDEIREIGNNGDTDGVLDSQAAWVPGKRHLNEDDGSISWRKRKKHFFILSHSGKPIYSRYGDEYKLAGFSATLQAIISFVENGVDRVKSVRAGKHQVVFLVKGPIYLVCINCTEELYESLRGQLELIYGWVAIGSFSPCLK